MSETNGRGASLVRKKKKRPQRSRMGKLKLKEVKLKRELKTTMNELKKNTQEQRKRQSLGTVKRQELANRSTIIRSKILRLKDEIDTRNFVKDDQENKRIQAKIGNSYASAARRHNRLLWMTAELERLKEDEEVIRAIANKDLGRETRRENEAERIDHILLEHRKTMAGKSRISATRFCHLSKELEDEAERREEHLEDVRDSLSKLGVETPQEKLEKADGLAHKYDMMSELRNLAHGQMISRQHKNSYWRINPPYRRKPKKMVHVRRGYAREFYEQKVDMVKARDMNEVKSTKTGEEKTNEDEEMNRFKMSSGRTISVKKMKDYIPPGMSLTPVEC